jgi:molybdenum-dependent DNA-binding transcriptional regulator ModE
MGFSFKKVLKGATRVTGVMLTGGLTETKKGRKATDAVSGQVTGQAAMEKAEKKQEKMDELAKRQMSEMDSQSQKQAALLAAKKRGRARTGGYGGTLGSQTSLGG